MLSIPASLGLIIASEQIINALFGYGSFNTENISNTASALKYFGYGVPAFALIKILSNFFFARNNTKIPFYISTLIVILNIILSVSFFSKVGFIIIPIATSISTWIGVVIYIFILNQRNFLLIKNYLFTNIFKIILNTLIMSVILIFTLEHFKDFLDYEYKYKSIYLLLIIGFAACIYLISCYLTGILKKKNFKTN